MICVGLAGFGLSGKIFQAPFLHADSRFNLKKVYERTSTNSKKEYPEVEVVRSFDELLTSDIDLVVISTPNPCHFEMSLKAMQAGKHVVVEKPVASTSKEVMELCEISKRENVVFSVYQNRRFDGDFLTVKKIINENMIGEVLDYECHFDRFVTGKNKKQWKVDGGKGIDLLYDIGVHLIDQAYNIFGMPNEVYADLRKQRNESSGIDNFQVYLYYKDKKVVLSSGEVVAMSGPHFAIHGTKGSFIKYGKDLQEGRLISGMRPWESDLGVDEEKYFGTLCRVSENEFLEEKIVTEIGDYGKYYDNIYHAINDGGELFVKPEEAIDVMKIIEAAQCSSAEKCRVKVV
ncbi:gfo/Idh/MocA family oxidoreductase [Candidatus Arthromitus sp. SFB-rat-Yit]|nr:gfo/Idh/MocA family oxidoreductase [Candidatus Arthromitus sp. SFB-rat-Yit]